MLKSRSLFHASGDALKSNNLGMSPMRDFRRRPLRSFLALIDAKWWMVVGTMMVFVYKHSPVVVFPLYLEKLMKILEEGGGLNELLWPTLGVVFLIITNIPSHAVYIHLTSSYIRRLEKTIRIELLRQLQYLTFSFHSQTNSGEIHAKTLRDVEQVENLFKFMASQVPMVLMSFVFAVTVTMFREPKMLLCYLILLPICLWISKSFSRVLVQRNEKFRREMECTSTAVSEMLELLPVTKSHGLEEHELSRVSGKLERLAHEGLSLDRGNAWFESSSFVTFQLSQVCCLMVTSYMVTQGWMGLPELVLYQTLFGMLMQSVNHFLSLLPQVNKGLESAKSLGEIMELEDLECSNDKKALDQFSGSLSFRDISFAYPEGKEVLKHVNFSVQAGECIALVGESGSGKSTLMNLIIGLYHPQVGEVMVDDLALSELNLSSWRQQIAVVSQNVILFSGSFRDNICYGLQDVDDHHFEQVIEAAQLKDVIKDCPDGLDTQLGENGIKLSGGQRQRIAIARALIRDPKVLILDEATSALDVISEKEVQKAIDAMVVGRTTFIVAHRLSTIRQAHRVMVMKKGCLVEHGTQEELLVRGGEFARLKSLQH